MTRSHLIFSAIVVTLLALLLWMYSAMEREGAFECEKVTPDTVKTDPARVEACRKMGRLGHLE